MASRFTRNVISEEPINKKFNWNTQVNDLLNDGIDLFYHDKDDNIRQLSQNREVADLYRITKENRKMIDENIVNINKNKQDIININKNFLNYYTKDEVDSIVTALNKKIEGLDNKILELSNQTRDNINKEVLDNGNE